LGNAGLSDRTKDYALESHVADIGAVLDALGWPQAHLVGMSFGGLIAAHFAASAPHRVSSLVTIDVGPGVAFEGTARTREFFQRVRPGAGPEAMVEAAMQISSSGDRERVGWVERSDTHHFYKMQYFYKMQLMGIASLHPSYDARCGAARRTRHRVRDTSGVLAAIG